MIEFDTVRSGDVGSLHALWEQAFPGSPVIALHGLDADRAARTFVAREAGEVPAVVYWLPRFLRGVAGQVLRVGCVSSVASAPRARGRGLVRRLLGSAVEAMAADGCDCSLLFTETPGVYEGSGWSTFARPHIQGRFASGGRLPDGWTVSAVDLGEWSVLAGLHARHNADSPLTVIRSAHDWTDRVPVWYGPSHRILLVRENGNPVAYAVVDWRAGDVVEIALGEDRAAGPLFEALAAEAGTRAVEWGRFRAPLDPVVRAALPALFASWHDVEDRTGMVRPVLASRDEVDAVTADRRAVYWAADYF